MKKHFILFLILLYSGLHAKDLIFSMTDNQLGELLTSNYDKIIQAGKWGISKSIILDKHVRKGIDREINKSVIYYPDGWVVAKVYKPKGVGLRFRMAANPNMLVRYDIKFRGDKNNILDHINPGKLIYNSLYITEDDLLATNENKGLKTKIENVGSIYLENPDIEGWFYIFMVEDSVSWPNTIGYIAPKSSIYFTYEITIKDENQFTQWLNTTKFTNGGKGDPIASIDNLRVVDREDPTETTIIKNIRLNNQGSVTNIENTIVTPQENRPSDNVSYKTEQYNVYGYGFTWEGTPFFYSPSSHRLYDLHLKKSIASCFSNITIDKDTKKITLGNTKSCVYGDRYINMADRTISYYFYTKIGKKWFRTDPKTNHVYYEQTIDQPVDVTKCFNIVQTKLNSVTLGGFIGNIQECRSIAPLFSSIHIDDTLVQKQPKQKDEAKHIPSSLDFLNNSQKNIADTEGYFITHNDDYLLIDKNNNALYLFKKLQGESYRRIDITECVPNMQIHDGDISFGQIDKSCPYLQNAIQDESQASSSSSQESHQSSSESSQKSCWKDGAYYSICPDDAGSSSSRSSTQLSNGGLGGLVPGDGLAQ